MTIAKRALLIAAGPFIFLYIAFIPLLCRHRKGFRGWYWRSVKGCCRLLLWLPDVRVSISPEALERLAKDENSLIVANHRSHLDGFSVMAVLPDEKWITFAAKSELCDAALLRVGFREAGLVRIDRADGKTALAALGEAVRDMPKRRSVLMFPEGTRARSDALGAFKAGAVLVARETGRHIRPLVIANSDRLLPRGKIWPTPGTITLDVMEPFVPEGETDAEVTRLRDQMQDRFAQLTAE